MTKHGMVKHKTRINAALEVLRPPKSQPCRGRRVFGYTIKGSYRRRQCHHVYWNS